jgi:hypothetical protein
MGRCARFTKALRFLILLTCALLLVRLCLEMCTNAKPVVLRLAGFYREKGNWHHCWLQDEGNSEAGVLARKLHVETGGEVHFTEMEVLKKEVHAALGDEHAPRSDADIKSFLDAFNARKKERCLSDEDLTRVIKSEVANWGLWSKLKFKWLIDAYKKAHPGKGAKSV